MTVIVESKRIKVTKALRTFVQDQAEKLLKLGKRITQVRVHLESVGQKNNDKNANSATFHISIPGEDIVVTKTAANMYKAIAVTANTAVRQLRKQYEKRRTLQRSGN